MVRATANPYGVGHNWVKQRFQLPLMPGRVRGPVIRGLKDKRGHDLPERCAIHSSLTENKILLAADPNYLTRIRVAAKNEAEYKAWIEGDWNIVAGGMFDDVWSEAIHVLPNFPLALIPHSWYINRAYDHGSSAPFSVGWWAQSNGEPLRYEGRSYGTVNGDLIRIREWYGWDGETANEGILLEPYEVARGIVQREQEWGLRGRVMRGPADTNLFDVTPGHANSAEDMARGGITWDRADKGAGSRKQGWLQIRKYLKQAAAHPREFPGLFVLENCLQFRRTLPVLPRNDADLDDINKYAEDHIADETRYRLRHKRITVETGAWK